MSHSARRINWLAESLSAKRYLEIGVETGLTFHQVNCSLKIGVDPKFLFELNRADEYNSHGSCFYHEVESDLFFRRQDRDVEPYDLIFIDGMHLFEQVMRDFVNSLSYAHARTVFLIDDTIPCDTFSAMRDQVQALDFRSRFSPGFQGNAWHGDVYLFVLMLPVYFPAYRYRTIVGSESNPQTIVWFDPDFNEVDEWTQARSLWVAQNLSGCGYNWMLENIDMLQPMGEEESLSLVVNRLQSMP